jgi:hypothetical protein
MTVLGGFTGTFHPRVPFPRQIQPMRIQRFDQDNLLRSPPALELFLAIDCLLNFVERLRLQQTFNLIFVGESFNTVEFVFKDRFAQLTCHANIERSREATHDVHAIGFSFARHGRSRGPSTPVDLHFREGRPSLRATVLKGICSDRAHARMGTFGARVCHSVACS